METLGVTNRHDDAIAVASQAVTGVVVHVGVDVDRGDVHDPEDVEDQLRAHTTSAADLHNLSPFGRTADAAQQRRLVEARQLGAHRLFMSAPIVKGAVETGVGPLVPGRTDRPFVRSTR